MLTSFSIFFLPWEAGWALLWPFITLARSLAFDPCVPSEYTGFLIAIIGSFPEQISTFFKEFSIWHTIYISVFFLSAIYYEDI